MATYIARRLLQMIPVFIGATFVIFSIVFLIGDPTVGRCGERDCPPAYIAAFRAEYNLDQPWLVQYGLYLLKIVQGDLGTAFNGEPVLPALLERWPTTIKLALMALAFEALIGVVAGIMAAIRKSSFWDSLVTVSTLVVISIPVFVIGSLGQLVLGVQLKIIPVTAAAGELNQLIFPAFVLGSTSIAYIARLMRSSLTETLGADYIRTARAKGLTGGRIVGVHGLRNSMIPIVTFLGYDLGSLLGGALITERIFNINGIGGFLFRGISDKDGSIVVGTVTCLVIVYLLSNLLVDVLYGVLDPRISHG